MTTRKDYHKELAIYQGIYQQHIKPIKDFYTPKVVFVLDTLLYSIFFGLLGPFQTTILDVIFLGVITLCIIRLLYIELKEKSKIKTKSLEINLPNKPLLKDVYINDSFRYKLPDLGLTQSLRS